MKEGDTVYYISALRYDSWIEGGSDRVDRVILERFDETGFGFMYEDTGRWSYARPAELRETKAEAREAILAKRDEQVDAIDKVTESLLDSLYED